MALINTTTTGVLGSTFYADGTGDLTIQQNGVLVNKITSNGLTYRGTGSVLQVVQTVKTSYFTSASASFVDVTGLSVTITPSSTTNKILVMFSAYGSQSGTAGTYGIHLRLVRDSTNIFLGDAAGSAQQSSGQIGSTNGHYGHNISGQFLDSPSTTSAITYKIQMYVETGGVTGGLGGSYLTSAAYDARTPSQITVMEIAG